MDPMCNALLLEVGANFMVWLLLGAILGLVALLIGRRRVEAAVRVSEARFRTLVEASADGIAIVDRSGFITYVSPAYERMSGYSAAELVGRRYAELLHPDDLAAAAGYFAALTGAPDHHALAEVRLRHRDGCWRIVEFSGRMLPSGDLVGSSRDRTEQRAAEAALRELNAGLEQRVAERTAELEGALAESRRLTAILEATSDLVGMADLDGRMLYINRNGRAMVGIDPEVEAARLSFADFYPPEALRRLGEEMLPRAIAQGSVLYETELRHQDGRIIPVSIVGIVHLGPDGRPERLSAVARDISERKRIEAELRAAKEAAEAALAESRRLAAILEATSDYVGIADIQGRMVYVNRAGRELLGLDPEGDIRRYSMGDQIAPSWHPLIFDQALPELLATGAWGGEIALRHTDGRAIPVSNVSVVLPGADGRPELLAAINRDITEQQLAQAELRQARDEAEAASRAKSTFLANMSHEIRTPMNAVIGMTGLLLNTALDPRQRDFVETIRSAGDALLAVINDILDFSKIEAGKLDLERQPFDLRACVEAAVDLLAPRADEKGLDLIYTVADDVPAGVLGDSARLRQILVNLLANAVKFTERGEVVMEVRTQEEGGRLNAELDQGRFIPHLSSSIRFSVRDTGIGIRPEQLPHLFQSFSQLDPSTTRVFGGTGLGLAISRRLAELMGGRMWAASDGPGQGATFSFTIAAAPAALPTRPSLRRRRPELAGRRALIVDDTPTNRRILSLQLQTWGLHPVEAATPGEALALLDAGERFDLAVLDMDLPEMDGVALATAVRARPGGQDLPMLMLTSLGHSGSEPCMQIFAACLSKPVKPSQLYDALAGLFAAELEPPAQRGGVQPASAAQPLLGERVPLRILLAEDVAVNQKFALLALEDLGYRADVAANGLEVLEAVARQPYDVVLMDVQMPELDGLEATRRIHQLWQAYGRQPALQRPYIVAMTANALQGDRELCLAAGMDDYIAKPVYLEELRAAVERAGASRASAEPVLDEAALRRLLARPRGRDILTLYAEESAALLGRVQVAALAADAGELREAAHSLKGSSRYLGAARVAELSAALEQLARSGELAAAAALAAELGAVHRQTLVRLAELR